MASEPKGSPDRGGECPWADPSCPTSTTWPSPPVRRPAASPGGSHELVVVVVAGRRGFTYGQPELDSRGQVDQRLGQRAQHR